jgi:hypothetical protein
MRSVTRWWPRGLGVGWLAAARFIVRTRGLFFSRFCEDAAACLANDDRRSALVCLWRGMCISPAHALRHAGLVGGLALQALGLGRPAAGASNNGPPLSHA